MLKKAKQEICAVALWRRCTWHGGMPVSGGMPISGLVLKERH